MRWGLNVNGFFSSVQEYLTDTNGYSMELRRDGA